VPDREKNLGTNLDLSAFHQGEIILAHAYSFSKPLLREIESGYSRMRRPAAFHAA